MFELHPTTDPVAVDLAHAALLLGAVASLKPSRVLELGFGAGHTANAILQALRWNQKGKLTVVDNWHDWQGQEPPHVQQLREQGAEVVVFEEEAFVRTAPANGFDLLVSDADHQRSDQWLDHHLRIVRPGGLLFFHDTANAEFPNLKNIVAQVEALNLPHYHFTDNSRPDERCDRGWLMVVNAKPRFALVTAWDEGAAEIGDFTWGNRQEYCRRHGYALRGGLVPNGGGVWCKPQAIATALAEGYEWVVWMDADSAITNTGRKLEEFTDGPEDLIVSYDVNGLNNGVIFMRNTDWARNFMTTWATEGLRFKNHPSADQTAMGCLLYREPKEKWKCVGQKAFNGFMYGEYPGLQYPEGQWQPGDFVLHLPSLPTARRKSIFRRTLPALGS